MKIQSYLHSTQSVLTFSTKHYSVHLPVRTAVPINWVDEHFFKTAVKIKKPKRTELLEYFLDMLVFNLFWVKAFFKNDAISKVCDTMRPSKPSNTTNLKCTIAWPVACWFHRHNHVQESNLWTSLYWNICPIFYPIIFF